MKKMGLFFGLTLLYLTVFIGIYVVHAWYFRVNVVFYAALFDMALATSLLGIVMFSPVCQSGLLLTEKSLLCVIWLLLGYAIAISGPTVIDRSLSFYILEKIDQRDGGIKQAAFSDVFRNEYMIEHRLVDIRLTEQLESGTIRIQDGCVQLTEKGRWMARASRWFRLHFLPKHRQILGEYSDDLTDPFRGSTSKLDTDYLCQ